MLILILNLKPQLNWLVLYAVSLPLKHMCVTSVTLSVGPTNMPWNMSPLIRLRRSNPGTATSMMSIYFLSDIAWCHIQSIKSSEWIWGTEQIFCTETPIKKGAIISLASGGMCVHIAGNMCNSPVKVVFFLECSFFFTRVGPFVALETSSAYWIHNGQGVHVHLLFVWLNLWQPVVYIYKTAHPHQKTEKVWMTPQLAQPVPGPIWTTWGYACLTPAESSS